MMYSQYLRSGRIRPGQLVGSCLRTIVLSWTSQDNCSERLVYVGKGDKVVA
jgi:hypothetical protein